jgi:hypothetical protein
MGGDRVAVVVSDHFSLGEPDQRLVVFWGSETRTADTDCAPWLYAGWGCW